MLSPLPMRRLLLVWLTLLTWGFYPWFADPFLVPREMVFSLGLWAIILKAIFEPVTATSRWKNPWLCPFLLWMLACNGWLFWGNLLLNRPASENIPFNFYTVIPTTTLLCVGVVVYLLATRIFVRLPDVVAILRWLCYLGASVAVYTLLQYGRYEQWFNDVGIQNFSNPVIPSTWMFATMGNVSYVAMFLAPLTPCYLIFREKRFLVLLGLVLLSLWLMHKIYGLLGAGVALASFGWLRAYHRFPRFKWGWVGLLPVVAALSGCTAWKLRTHLTHDWRWSIWGLIHAAVHRRVLTGYGLGSFAQNFFVDWDTTRQLLPASFPKSRWLWAHNDLFQLAYEGGLVAVSLAIGAIWSALSRAFRRSSHIIVAACLSSAVSVLVISLMNFPWHFAPAGAVIVIVWAIVECEPEGGWT